MDHAPAPGDRYNWPFNSPKRTAHNTSIRDFVPLKYVHSSIEGVTMFNGTARSSPGSACSTRKCAWWSIRSSGCARPGRTALTTSMNRSSFTGPATPTSPASVWNATSPLAGSASCSAAGPWLVRRPELPKVWTEVSYHMALRLRPHSRLAAQRWYLRTLALSLGYRMAWCGLSSLPLPESWRRQLRRTLGRPADWVARPPVTGVPSSPLQGRTMEPCQARA